jgi:hypothetical protein
MAMKDKESKGISKDGERESSSCFRLSGKFTVIQDRFEYDKRIESLPPEQQELLKQLTNFADLCKYFQERGQRLDGSLADAMNQAAGLPLEERIARIRQINQKLMEGVEDAGEGPQLRH